MSKKKAALMTVLWATITLFFVDHLFEIPGLIARHHQGVLAQAFGPWVSWAFGIVMLVVSARFTLVYTKLWLQARSTVNEVR